jgi:RNA polymerase primary sigma factor
VNEDGDSRAGAGGAFSPSHRTAVDVGGLEFARVGSSALAKSIRKQVSRKVGKSKPRFDASLPADHEGPIGHEDAADDFAVIDEIDVVEEPLEEDEEEVRPATGVDPIDDPVRMYLMQMGQIPLLNREQEVSIAREIE